MFTTLHLIKGLHPGFFLENELKKRKISKKSLAENVGEHLQTIVSITKGRRKFTTLLSIKTERFLNLEEGFLLTLQAFFEIEKEKENIQIHTPNLTIIRPILFWDTDVSKINWIKEKESVIKRVLERGNNLEKEEINRFYNSIKNENQKVTL
jgi:plasmid maintenance system antidote protein VapI